MPKIYKITENDEQVRAFARGHPDFSQQWQIIDDKFIASDKFYNVLYELDHLNLVLNHFKIPLNFYQTFAKIPGAHDEDNKVLEAVKVFNNDAYGINPGTY